MRYGVPVLASAIASISEILDNAALYFAPFSVEEIMNRILQITDDDTYMKYSNRSKERYNIVKKRQDNDLDEIINFIVKE